MQGFRAAEGENPATPETSATSSSTEDPDLLMVQAARSAEFETADDGTVELVLTDVDDDTIYFSDRPNHIAGAYDTVEFVNEILPGASSAQDGPPNAALVWQQDEVDHAVIVELGEATYDADRSVVRYQVTIVEDEPELLATLGTITNLPTGPVGPAWLYIDDLTTWETCIVRFDNTTGDEFLLGDVIVKAGEEVESLPDTLESILAFNDSSSATWEVQQDEILNACTGTVEWNETTSGFNDVAVGYAFFNADTGDNVQLFYCSEDYSCFNENYSNSTELSNNITICPAGNNCALDTAEPIESVTNVSDLLNPDSEFTH